MWYNLKRSFFSVCCHIYCVMVPIVIQKVFNFTRPHLLIFYLSSCAVSVLFRESFLNLFIYCVCNILSACMSKGQKRAPDLIIDGCEPPCGCWELNSGPLEEQVVLLTTEPSHHPNSVYFLALLECCTNTINSKAFSSP